MNPFDVMEKTEHRLPHWQQGEVLYFVTWRLADSLPQVKLIQWTQEKELWLSRHPRPWNENEHQEYHDRFNEVIDRWLDAGEGSCLLREANIRKIIYESLLHFDGVKYQIKAFVIMPNHVHVLFCLGVDQKLEKIVHGWKSFTARQINELSDRKGHFWQEDYWDRMVRREHHLQFCLEYIKNNPLKANLMTSDYSLYVNEVLFSEFLEIKS